MCVFPFYSAVAQNTVITYEIGDYLVTTLSEGGENAKSSLLVGATPEILQKYLPDGVFPLQIQAFLVRTPDRTVLIDAGIGKNLFTNLQSLNVAEDQISTILLTHMHGDHIGGLLRDGKKAFSHADLYLSKAEYDYWTSLQGRGADARKVLEVYKDKLHLFTPAEIGKEPNEILPGFEAVATYGHTPGHTAYLIESAKSRLLIWGDIAHALPVQMPHPEVSLSFDSNPAQAAQTRKNILEYVFKNEIKVAGAHIEFPAIGNIVAGKEEGYEFVALCTCEGI
jgi:glyoxylase-like metal-dependent hydrolase (beta-lactamase superfamily II)